MLQTICEILGIDAAKLWQSLADRLIKDLPRAKLCQSSAKSAESF